MSIPITSKTRIIQNLTNTRQIIMKPLSSQSEVPLGAGDFALLTIALALTNIAEIMLESEEVSKVQVIPDGEAPIVGRGN